jgi:WD40 repeat protein
MDRFTAIWSTCCRRCRHLHRPTTFTALIVWLIGVGALWVTLPPPPRLILRAPERQRMLGFSSDGRTLITVGNRVAAPLPDESDWPVPVWRWDLQTGVGERIAGPLHPATRVVDSEADGNEVDTEPGAPCENFVLAPGGQTLADQVCDDSSSDEALRLLDLRSGRVVLRLDNASLHKSRFSADSRWFSANCRHSREREIPSLQIYECTTGKLVLRRDDTAPDHVVFSPDGNLLAFSVWGSHGYMTEVWDIRSSQRVMVVDGYPGAFSPDGHTLAGVSDSKEVRLYETAAGTLQLSLPVEEMFNPDLTFPADGRTISAYQQLGISGIAEVRTWDATTGRLVTRLVPPSKYFECHDPNEEPDDFVSHPDRTPRIVVKSDEHGWNMFDVFTGEQRPGLPTNTHPCRLSPDGRVAVTYEDVFGEDFWLWNWLEDHFTALQRIQRNDCRKRLWDVSSRRELLKIDGARGRCLFAPDSRSLVTQKRYGDATIEVWDVPPRRPLVRILIGAFVPAIGILLLGYWRARCSHEQTYSGRNT